MPKGMAKQHAREPGHVSVRNKTVAMVEGHLNKQRSAYDHWIAELCRDAEESAMERDRLKAKLAALRDDHKRKVMTKIIGRLGNMNYFVAWNHWHTVTIKDAQKRAGERIRELKKQLKECKKKFNCNGTIVDDPELGDIIQLQGDQRKLVAQFLIDEKIAKKDVIKVHGS